MFRSCGYTVEKGPLGNVYIPLNAAVITGQIGIRYERHPWIERFEIDGLVPAKPRRTGYGTKDAKGFVKSLSTIYAYAYDDHREYGDDTAGYFAHVTDYFVTRSREKQWLKLFGKFCGFTENVWREGTKEMHDIAIGVMLPVIEADAGSRQIFYETITEEFRKYIKGGRDGTEKQLQKPQVPAD